MNNNFNSNQSVPKHAETIVQKIKLSIELYFEWQLFRAPYHKEQGAADKAEVSVKGTIHPKVAKHLQLEMHSYNYNKIFF